MKKSRLLIAGSVVSLALFSSMPSFAQDAAEEAAVEAEEEGAEETILVTGSRIRQPNIESNLPVTSITSRNIFLSAPSVAGRVMNMRA